ncbi:MAG TPA: ABC transporter substrate-binding protein [Candidatus Omnitrophica bacterium]|nr:MAG: ABC transporter substrate-binding protein [Omnitrophica WOR_2 bacterium GWA2_45_18]HBR15386.1 ABC transporter substrate-binding protein [Candidatus Omnitrophota bacterium]
MWGYILKRFLVAIPILLAIAFVTFLLMRFTPGNYLDTMRMDPQYSKATIQHYEELYQLDKPLLQQYLQWIKNILRLEFGYSFYYNVPVVQIIGGRLWNTFVLSCASFLFTWGVALPLGITAALRRNQWLDRLIQFFSYVWLSVPSFFLAMILLYAASQTGFLPLGGMVSPNFEEMNFLEKALDILKHLAIPTIALSVGSIAALQRIMRGNMLEVLGQQYILMARAKGLPENKVVYHHALRNAINPLITLLGYEFSSLLSGAALIEIICGWPGLGALMLTAVRSKDIYLVMASMLMGSVLFIIGNLLADILLAKADPRIRYERG